MSETVFIQQATIENIPTIQHIANISWQDTYSNMLSPEQMEYMLQKMYATETLSAEITKTHSYFLAFNNLQSAVGFAAVAAYEPPLVYKLHKLYLLPEAQQKGVGKALLKAVIARVAEKNGNQIILRVNRANPAKSFYERMGFTIIDEQDFDIGNGFFMNDYVMRLML